MAGEDLPPLASALRSSGDASPDKSGDFEAPAHRLVAALAMFPDINQASYRLVERCFGHASGPGWPSIAALIADAGVADPSASAGSCQCRPEWRELLGSELDDLGGPDIARSRLLDVWLEEPDPRLLDTMAVWAHELSRWDALQIMWLLLAEQSAGLSAETLELFRDLPTEARHAHPILTWASGAAASLLVRAQGQQMEAFWQRLLLDSTLLHADWAIRGSIGEAVTAGTFRMIGERRLPATEAGQSLDAAWCTKRALDQLIDARSRVGDGPGRTPQAVFRAFSARLALFRFDPLTAIDEARWAAILADWEPVARLAKGVEALATAISTEDGPEHYSDPPLAGIGGGLGVLGLRGMGELYEILADGHEAVRRLDRDGVDRCLSIVTPDAAAVAGVWAVRVALQAWRAARWGDVNAGIVDLSEAIERLSIAGREQDEPMGNILLSRTRVVLLSKAGAFAAAAGVADGLPEQFRLVSAAGIHLWAGQYRQAIQLSDAGPYQPGLAMAARYRLALIRVAAGILKGSMSETLRRDAVREVTRLVEKERFVHLALVPRAARTALLELCRPELNEADPKLRLLRRRLEGLNDHTSAAGRPFHLTERELLLLPMLATDDPVPEIAKKLQVSANTVRKQVVTLREKFAAESRPELIRKAKVYGALH